MTFHIHLNLLTMALLLEMMIPGAPSIYITVSTGDMQGDVSLAKQTLSAISGRLHLFELVERYEMHAVNWTGLDRKIRHSSKENDRIFVDTPTQHA